MKKIIKKKLFFLGGFLGWFLNCKVIFKFLNFIYERSNRNIINFIVKFVDFPNTDYVWKIKLINNKIVESPVLSSNIKTRQFALSYQWHSPCMNKLEHILNEYYPIEYPWIDVGANLGLRSLLPLSYGRPVYFIEPNAELNSINKERCVINNFSNYTFFQCGASNEEGIVEFFIDKSSFNSTIEGHLLKESVIVTEKQQIKINTLDNLFADKIESIKGAYIKIDVEGHELKTLQGGMDFIAKVKPSMLIEVNDKGEHLKNFFNVVENLNYVVFELGNFRKNKILKNINTRVADFHDVKYNDFFLVKSTDNELLKRISNYIV